MEKSSGARMKANTDIYLPRLSWTCLRKGGSIARPNCRRISPWATSHRRRKTNPGSRTPRTRIKRHWLPRRKCRRHRCFLERRTSRFLTRSEATSFNCSRSRQQYFRSSPRRRTSREHEQQDLQRIASDCRNRTHSWGVQFARGGSSHLSGITTIKFFTLRDSLEPAFDMLDAAQFEMATGLHGKRGGSKSHLDPNRGHAANGGVDQRTAARADRGQSRRQLRGRTRSVEALRRQTKSLQ